MEQTSVSEHAEFETLHACLEARLAMFGSLYQRGSGDILVRHDYFGNREVGVILRKTIEEFTLLRVAHDCLSQVRTGWEVWFTYDQSLGDIPSLVVTRGSSRHVQSDR